MSYQPPPHDCDPNKFWMPDSPLHGWRVPTGWSDMSLDGKRRMLMSNNKADTWSQACSLLSRHGAAVRAYRKAKRAHYQS